MTSSGLSSEAKWIWIPGYDDTSPEGQIVLFRRTFNLSRQRIDPVFLKISADTRYRLFVNGHSVSFGPCKSYPGRWYYETVNISDQLHEGLNSISARVLRFSSAHPGSFSLSRGPFPGLIVDCSIEVRMSPEKILLALTLA
jgi:alpha-L-rhamnosidase